MIMKRNWAVRLSIGLNVCVLLYVCAHFGSSGPWLEDGSTNWDNGAIQASPLVQENSSSDNMPPVNASNQRVTDLRTTKETSLDEKNKRKTDVVTSSSDNGAKDLEATKINLQTERGPGEQEVFFIYYLQLKIHYLKL